MKWKRSVPSWPTICAVIMVWLAFATLAHAYLIRQNRILINENREDLHGHKAAIEALSQRVRALEEKR